MLIGDEKYACEACIRGHRSSSCRHSDRPLALINKKGRPASQCSHCRTLRKSRSAHVKCSCGEKTAGMERDSKVKTCSCTYGGRCSCALKKDIFNPAHRSDSDENPILASSNEIPKLRTLTPPFENAAGTLSNGHQESPQVHSNMLYTPGLPYTGPTASLEYSTLPSNFAHGSIDNLPHMSTLDAIQEAPYITDSMVAAAQEQRMAELELNSLHLASSPHFNHLNCQLSPLEMSSLDQFYDDFQTPVNIDLIGTSPEIN